MRAGRLRKRITIEAVMETRDAYGEPAETWSAYQGALLATEAGVTLTTEAGVELTVGTTTGTYWADVIPISGREYFTAKSVHADVTHKFRIRYQSGITPKHRISYDSRVFDIRDVIDVDARKRTLEMIAIERVQ